jgi:hypothetical protein
MRHPMKASDDNQDCPVCGTSGLRRRGKSNAHNDAPATDRCLACNGAGAIPTGRLRALVLAAVRAMAAAR